MKNTPLIISIAAVVIAIAACVMIFVNPFKSKQAVTTVEGTTTAAAGDIVFIRLDTLMLQYDMAGDMQSAFEAKAQSVEEELNKKGRKLESDMKAFENQYQKGLLTRSAAEQQQQALMQRQQNLQNEAQQKQMELQEENAVMLNNIMYSIKTYLEELNKTRGYAAILTTSEATNIVIVGDSGIDITQEVVEGLNAEYAKNRNAKPATDSE